MGKQISIWAYKDILEILSKIQGKNKFVNIAIKEKFEREKNAKRN